MITTRDVALVNAWRSFGAEIVERETVLGLPYWEIHESVTLPNQNGRPERTRKRRTVVRQNAPAQVVLPHADGAETYIRKARLSNWTR